MDASHLKSIPLFSSLPDEELGAIASVQPYHAIDDGRWAERLIGHERARTTYAFRALLDARTRLEPQGAGMAHSLLSDEHGPLGLAAQSLFVAERS